MKTKTFLLAAAVAASVSAFADKVTLKSGSFLTGTADIIRDGVLKFNSDDLGEVLVKLDSIVALESDKMHVVEYNDGTRSELALTVADGKLVVDAQPVNMDNVKRTDPEEEKWHGSSTHRGYPRAATPTTTRRASWQT